MRFPFGTGSGRFAAVRIAAARVLLRRAIRALAVIVCLAAMVPAMAPAMVLLAGSAAAAERDGRVLIGVIENITLVGLDLSYRAKIDTGAESSSLDVASFHVESGKGNQIVHFVLRTDDGGERQLSLPLKRYVKIRRAGTERERRPVVEMALCLGGIKKTAEVNLTQRPRMNYRFLVGRHFLAGSYLVDPGGEFIAPSGC